MEFGELEFLAKALVGIVICVAKGDCVLITEYLIFGRGRENSIVSWLCPFDSGRHVARAFRPRVSDERSIHQQPRDKRR